MGMARALWTDWGFWYVVYCQTHLKWWFLMSNILQGGETNQVSSTLDKLVTRCQRYVAIGTVRSVTPAGRCVASLNKQEFADRGAWHDISNGIFAVFVTLELSFVEAVPEWTRLQSETAALLNNFLIERGEWFVIVLQWLYHFIMVLKRRKLQDLHYIYIYT